MSSFKFMTTKEIISDSKNLPCDIAEVEWVLKSEYDESEKKSLSLERLCKEMVEYLEDIDDIAAEEFKENLEDLST